LTKIENLQSQQETLEELMLSHNAIDDEGASQATGLALNFPNLNVLDLCRNRLTSTAPFAHLTGLEELWLSGNLMETLDAVLPLKEAAENESSLPRQQLETIYLEYNPVAQEFEYRKRLAEWIPNLKQIDATLIGGLGAHGMSNVSGASSSTVPLPLMEQMRQFQQLAVERAQQETNPSSS
jgi:protein phosphatase 1 regulatory subunit 7